MKESESKLLSSISISHVVGDLSCALVVVAVASLIGITLTFNFDYNTHILAKTTYKKNKNEKNIEFPSTYTYLFILQNGCCFLLVSFFGVY